MRNVDASAHVAPQAQLGEGVSIGPGCVVGPDVALGDGCSLVANVHVTGHTTIGARTVVYPFASLGTPPQSTNYRGGPTRLVIGADCDIREGVTVNRGTEDDGGLTQVGERCFLMVGSHVAHDCKVGDGVIFANNAVLGGHVKVGNNVVFGGQAAVRQFVRIGEGAMIVGLSGVRADVVPWGLVQGPLADLVGLNVIGMKRRGYKKSDIHRLRAAYQDLFFGAGVFRDRVDALAGQHDGDALIDSWITFIRSGTRPLTMASRRAEAGEAL